MGSEMCIRDRSGSVFFATLVNGGQKYLPAPDAYEKITYEAMNSGFAAGSHERLLQTILAALNAARQKGELA